MKSLHIAISSDSNYLEHSIIASKSVAENNLIDFDEVHIHFFSNGIPPELIMAFQSSLKKFGLHTHVYDISDIRARLGIDIPPTISLSSYARLFLGSLLPQSVSRVIYMDVDAINVSSFGELWETDLSGVSVAGVLDDVATKAKTMIGLQNTKPYVNAGFLLINLQYWRENNLEKQFLDFLHHHKGNVFHHDQGIINAVCNNSIAILPPRYNMVSNFFSQPYSSFKQTPFYTEKDLDEGRKKPVFLHFTPGVVNRPWFKNCRHPLKNEYLKYRNMTEYGQADLPFDNRPLRLRLLSFLFFNCRPAYDAVIKLRQAISSKI